MYARKERCSMRSAIKERSLICVLTREAAHAYILVKGDDEVDGYNKKY